MRESTHRGLSRRQFVKISASLGLIALVGLPLTKIMAQQPLSSPGTDFDLRYDDPSGKTHVIEALALTLSQNDVPGDMNLLVRADTITLASNLSLPSHSITLVAREIVCLPSAAISTAGPTGVPSFSSSAAMEKDGDTGGTGSGGGNVSIYADRLTGILLIDVRGGQGGDAQAGGPGKPGQQGTRAVINRRGGNGHDGTQGGLAGTPGMGGAGGLVLVALREPFQPQSLVATIKGGPPGHPAKHGDPGKGGDPGPGNSGTVMDCSGGGRL